MALLKTRGMRPSDVVDGASALRALTQAKAAGDPFKVAILDMQMPGMDGKSLGHAIKSDLTLNETWLVLCESLGQMGNDQDLKEIGFAATLSKPVGRQELFDVLTAVLSGKEIDPSQMNSEQISAARACHLATRAEDCVTGAGIYTSANLYPTPCTVRM